MNYEALTRIITRDELRAFQQQPEVRKSKTQWWVIMISAMVGLMLIAFMALAGGRRSVQETLGPILGLALIMTPVMLISWFVTRIYQAKIDIRHLRLLEFATTNNLNYSWTRQAPSLPGMIFAVGDSRATSDRISTLDGAWEVGSYSYSTGSGKNRVTHVWGYLAIPLNRHVPQMVLDATGNDTKIFGLRLSDLPEVFHHSQELHLEGDFDKYFTLYAPKEYEQDALYIFTPDLMALLIDDASQFDVETVDDMLFIYKHGTYFDLTSEAEWQRLMAVVETVGAKTIRQTNRYADDRVGNPNADIIAEPGRRLKKSAPALVGVVLIVIIIWNVVSAIWR